MQTGASADGSGCTGGNLHLGAEVRVSALREPDDSFLDLIDFENVSARVCRGGDLHEHASGLPGRDIFIQPASVLAVARHFAAIRRQPAISYTDAIRVSFAAQRRPMCVTLVGKMQ